MILYSPARNRGTAKGSAQNMSIIVIISIIITIKTIIIIIINIIKAYLEVTCK